MLNSALGSSYTLTPKKTGGYQKKSVHTFCPQIDGQFPRANPISDASGNLYGTTIQAVYELMPQQDGTWQTQVLREFLNNERPDYGKLIFGTGGLYGTTAAGGNGFGTVFVITP